MLLVFVFLAGEIPISSTDVNSNDASLKHIFIPAQENHPPFPPIIEGPIKGKVRELYQYNITVNDPDGDFLFKMEIDFGDGKILSIQEEACGCKKPWWKPNTTVYVFHKWRKSGEYLIRARVMDIWSEWSDWATLKVNMERKITFLLNFKSLHSQPIIIKKWACRDFQHTKMHLNSGLWLPKPQG